MRINTAKGKTEFIHNNRRTEGFDVCTGNVTMNLTSSYKNFGVMVDEGNNQETEIGARIEKYIKNFRLMHPLLKEKYVPREVKTAIYKTILKPVLMFEAECWSLTEKTTSRVQAAEIKV